VLKSPSKPAVVTVMDSAELDKLKAEIESLKSQLAEKTATNEALETTNKGLIEKDIPELKYAFINELYITKLTNTTLGLRLSRPNKNSIPINRSWSVFSNKLQTQSKRR
jgi:hypothetical protein